MTAGWRAEWDLRCIGEKDKEKGMPVVELFGQCVEKLCENSGGRARWLLKTGWQAQNLRYKLLPLPGGEGAFRQAQLCGALGAALFAMDLVKRERL